MNTGNQDYEQLQKIFLGTLELNRPEERKAYLDAACGNDQQIRNSIEALLKEYEEGGSVLQSVDESSVDQVEPANAVFVTGTLIADRYRIVSMLGRGGMGEVYRADDLKLEQPVALKFLPAALAQDQRLLKALYNEVRLARRVTHRNVSRVYDIGEAEGLHFLSMEYIEGEDLGGLLRRIGRLPGDKAISLAQQLCAGLQAAHEKGLLHLDLKPGNLMIDQRGDLRITDFGLARMTREAEVEKRRSGTPTYMAPEQLLHGNASERSDLYAVGLILFEMFTGRRMHGARSAEEMVDWHKTTGRASQQVLESTSHLKPDIKALIYDCTTHDPLQRHATVGAVLAELEKLEPTSASVGQSTELAVSVAPPTEELKFSDVFIAYAPVDDKPLIAGKPGWIAQFHDHLQVRLEQLSGESIKIWRDVSLQTGEPNGELLENLPSAKTMVTIMSPPFVKAPGCMQEVDTFWKSAERSGTFRISDKTRILKVMKTPVPSGVASPEVEHLMSQLAGFEFYETDQQTGRVFAYDETFGDKAMQRYFEKVYDLAYEIRDVLQALEGSGKTTRSITGKTVYLAETTADLRSERDKLKRELLENGHRVLPELPLPLSGLDFEKEVRLLLVESNFAVHLVGERYGMVPEDMQASVVEIQNWLAAERADSDGLERLIWMPRGVQPRDERQEAFVRRLVEDPETHRGGEVVQDAMENFKQMLLKTLTPPLNEEAVVTAPRRGKEGVPSIYLIYDRRDEEAIEPLEDLLFELGFEVTSPSFEGDEDEVAKVHQHNLQNCDGALVFYGSVSKPWVDMKLMDIAQAPGYGRCKELLATGVYITPSEDRRKARFRTHLADVIRPNTAEIDSSHLEPFTTPLRA
ncbi:MAG: serine/threonine protein kinase [Verrucomicrobiales bacterium]|jgi:serine/threonine protein kinase